MQEGSGVANSTTTLVHNNQFIRYQDNVSLVYNRKYFERSPGITLTTWLMVSVDETVPKQGYRLYPEVPDVRRSWHVFPWKTHYIEIPPFRILSTRIKTMQFKSWSTDYGCRRRTTFAITFFVAFTIVWALASNKVDEVVFQQNRNCFAFTSVCCTHVHQE